MEPITTAAAIASLLNSTLKITREVLQRVDARAEATGQTRQEVFAEVAAAARARGEAAAAAVADQASRTADAAIESAIVGWYGLTPIEQALIKASIFTSGSLTMAAGIWLRRKIIGRPLPTRLDAREAVLLDLAATLRAHLEQRRERETGPTA